ncbi:hypothetical protein [Gangjinia marincola]
MYKQLYYLVICCLLGIASAKAQEDIKAEKEERIEKSAMPAASLKTLLAFPFERYAYYKEIDGNIVSYEAKTKRTDPDYSIEFDAKGRLEDVEEEIKKRSMSKAERKLLQQKLDSIDQQNKIERIQLQYLPNENINELNKRIANKNFDHYELVVAFKNNRTIYRLELLFDRQGKLLKSRKVTRIAYDFILF